MVSEVDRLLSQVRSETARELLECKQTLLAIGIQPVDDAIAEAAGSKTSPVIEFLGLPGSGKSHVLWHICAKAAMSQTVPTADDGESNIVLNGANKHVLLFDIDGRADLCMLSRHMEGVYKEAIASANGLMMAGGPNTESTQRATRAAVREALGRVHVFAPASTNALVATLGLVPKYLVERKISGPVVLLIDGLGNNYGFERKEASYVRKASRNATPWFRMQQVLVDTVQRVHQRFSCLTVATGLLMLPVSDAAASGEGSQQRIVKVDQGEFRDHMIPRWLNIVSSSFVLEKTRALDALATAISITPIDKCTHQKLADKRLVMHVGDHGLHLPLQRAG
ncbi:hypothetical protein IW140_004958 [Coemansia sp. RSA 1813]|nr:hypothetical protein EV178_004933 [Coemansia sp. RSA 1646]KAJ1770073.1 hypothetical protein LPJ74_003514 [Coemansia sp. RSA 1843]KAJ2087426.1 hypothetical protein IW138_004964 [Coemansia sp. RSA 986]KAJ2212416.1 hypothetical protein EV179_004669 [Coemansia sp. RSA 487]KAJ2566415.1 hypothetical protein IW140_004958 [Coemansia sp. RSA 1813]